MITSIGLPTRPKPAAKAKDKGGEARARRTSRRTPVATETEETIKLDDSTPLGQPLLTASSSSPIGPVSLRRQQRLEPGADHPRGRSAWLFPGAGLFFMPLDRKLPPQGIGAAISRGMDDTVENILSIYAMIRSLAQRRVGPKSLAGPVGIAQIAYDAASNGLTTLIHFLGFISINLAVINFLPIPPLDGGQMVFLAAEKIRGKPLPDSALSPGDVHGHPPDPCLFLFVTYQDVFRLIGDWTGVHH